LVHSSQEQPQKRRLEWRWTGIFPHSVLTNQSQAPWPVIRQSWAHANHVSCLPASSRQKKAHEITYSAPHRLRTSHGILWKQKQDINA
jgi:hypothetical protein